MSTFSKIFVCYPPNICCGTHFRCQGASNECHNACIHGEIRKKRFYGYVTFFSFFGLYPLETVCMKCQILFYGKNKKNLITGNLSSAESAHRVVSSNSQMSVRNQKKKKKKCCKIMLFLNNGFIYFTHFSDYLLTKLLK